MKVSSRLRGGRAMSAALYANAAGVTTPAQRPQRRAYDDGHAACGYNEVYQSIYK